MSEKFEIHAVEKIRKYKPHSERNAAFPELLDLNLYYKHEIPLGAYDYDDALTLYLNRASNNVNAAAGEYQKEKIKTFRNLYAEGGLDAIKNTDLYIETKALLDRVLSNPDVEKNIPKEYWDKFSNFYGVNPAALHHWHFYQAFEKELADLEKCERSENLVVLHCSNRKPYGENKNYCKFLKCSKETRRFDVCVLSLYPTMVYPLDTSVRYPHICYDWPHVESPGMLYAYEAHNLRMLAYLVKRLGYKNVVIIEWKQMQHLHLLRDYYGIDYISLRESQAYANYHRWLFSTHEFKDGDLVKEWLLVMRTRILQGSRATNLFMRDLFGEDLKQWFINPQCGWDEVPDDVKEFCKFPEKRLKTFDNINFKVQNNSIEEW